jgi:hypothetical protein
MLLTLMSNLNMFGSDVPQVPPFIPHGGNEEEVVKRKSKLKALKEDAEILEIIKIFLKCQD